MQTRGNHARPKTLATLPGVWLNPGQIHTSIESLLLRMLTPRYADPVLRAAVCEELHRRTKFTDVVLRSLGLQGHVLDTQPDQTVWLVSPVQLPHPWHETLLALNEDCPLGLVVNTYDHGTIVLLHEVFQQLTAAQQDAVLQYAALAIRGKQHADILAALDRLAGHTGHYQTLLRDARRRVRVLGPSVLFSPDGGLRVELGSLSQTTKNILREGIAGEYLFILPKHLFEGKTNYADVEFLVYLNFFVRYGMRTRIAGTARQRDRLERLLQLTIFGLFSPQHVKQPSFETLRERYQIPDQDTYRLFRMLYEKYGVRAGFRPTGAILGLDSYIDFIILHEAGRPTMITTGTPGHLSQEMLPLPCCEHPADLPATMTATHVHGDHEDPPPYQVCVTASAQGTFDVTITQADGQQATKTLDVYRPPLTHHAVPAHLSKAIRFATDRPRFGVTPLGTSHGFDQEGDLTSFVIWLNGCGILVDPSPEALGYLEQIGVAAVDIPYVLLTHVHADHDGGLIEKLLSGSRTVIIASDVVLRLLIEKAKLVTGQDFLQEGLVEHIPANPGQAVHLEMAGEHVMLQTRWNLHTIPTNGFLMTVDRKTFGYAGDTQYDPDMLQQLLSARQLTRTQYDDLMYFFWNAQGTPTVDLLYHEAGIPPIHTDKNQLAALPKAVKARTFLVHIADRDVPPDFQPTKPQLFATHVLYPATAQSRARTLLYTLGYVSYLYDIPANTLERLLQMATLRVFEPGDTIIHAGQVPYGQPLTFYVITDGQVAVMESGRSLATLVKADSFGEWGISHQRGFRISDIVAQRPTQVLEFPEEAYHWMVEAHPVIQRRIGKIRELWPKLQAVRAHARQKSAQDPLRTRSVIEDMSSGQLSAFAVFSEVKKAQRLDAVLREGENADGLYIVLSGHLTVSVSGRTVGELNEADVFGEVGLLQERKRNATVGVASADADLLFMSRENFQTLLQKVPAFSFGVHAVAAQRQERTRRRRAHSPQAKR